MRLALTRAGYRVLDARNVPEAITLSQSMSDPQVDLLIIDHRLAPDVGRSVAEHFVKLCPEIKILVVSGSAYQTVQAEDGLLPGSSFLQKPFTPHQLLSTVEHIIFPEKQ